MMTKFLLPPLRLSRRSAPVWVSLARVAGVMGALAAVTSKLVRWAKRYRLRSASLPLDVADLTEVASIPPPAPPPRHHPRVPSLSRPDVHAFEAAPGAVIAATRPADIAPPR